MVFFLIEPGMGDSEAFMPLPLPGPPEKRWKTKRNREKSPCTSRLYVPSPPRTWASVQEASRHALLVSHIQLTPEFCAFSLPSSSGTRPRLRPSASYPSLTATAVARFGQRLCPCGTGRPRRREGSACVCGRILRRQQRTARSRCSVSPSPRQRKEAQALDRQRGGQSEVTLQSTSRSITEAEHET